MLKNSNSRINKFPKLSVFILLICILVVTSVFFLLYFNSKTQKAEDNQVTKAEKNQISEVEKNQLTEAENNQIAESGKSQTAKTEKDQTTVAGMSKRNDVEKNQKTEAEGSKLMIDKQMFNNPIIKQRADPWVYKHTDGYYYFSASVPEYDRIEIRRAKTIQELGSATTVVIWTKHSNGEMSANVWAPEIHYMNGKWYIYFAAAREDAIFDHRVYVLENSSPNPLEGKWIEKGKIKMNWESFTLDATTFEYKGIDYLVWAQRDFDIRSNSNLYIAPMSNPWTISGNQVMLSKPEYDWETIGFSVNEGAAVVIRNGRIFISYSASATDYNYCMGLLTASDSSNLLKANSWAKSSSPLFVSSEKNGQYGPGHNCFTVSADGSEDILIYHARNYKEIDGDPLYDPNRHTRAQKLNWNSDGTPNFGVPVPDGEK